VKLPLLSVGVASTMLLISCQSTDDKPQVAAHEGKPVVYQVFTRLFGNHNTNNKPWGTIEENGVGKFSDFDDTALAGIKKLGVTHLWYTGVMHHAVITDYTSFGLENDDPDVVKGRAGSPYAIKDYYNVNPDLATNPAQRLNEFKQLIGRTHQHDMKVIVDIVPNHVARGYHSTSKPKGVSDFGTNDNKLVEYDVNNNFYYVPGQDFKVPLAENDYQPLGGEKHEMTDGQFSESPAKWTGNGSRAPQPHANDWYETVKVNYGVHPDGQYDFATLPADYANKDWRAHYQFWQGKTVPDSWLKFRDITQYWLNHGVDGFRYDMAEMVPVEFWSYLNSHIKMTNQDAFILAEVYNPKQYRNYIKLGLTDYLYDKVGFYDTLKGIMQDKENTSALVAVQHEVADIETHMLHFLENHDEQRIASPEFAGDARKGMPAMVVSSTISTSPTMLYFAQAMGEDGSETAGFGQPSRTSIFDYIGVPALQRWTNNGKFDGAKLTTAEKALQQFYRTLMNIVADSPALNGEYQSLHAFNLSQMGNYSERQLSFVRWSEDQKLVIASNFNATKTSDFSLGVPHNIVSEWDLTDGEYLLTELIGDTVSTLKVSDGVGTIDTNLAPLGSVIYQVEPAK